MNFETAVDVIMAHGVGRQPDGSDCRDDGFLGCLRPYSGYRAENFFELVEAIICVAAQHSGDVSIDCSLIRALLYIPATARRWALDPDSMLQRNRLISDDEAAELLLAVQCLEGAIDRLLADEDPAWVLDWYRQHSRTPTDTSEATMEVTGFDNVVFTTAEPRAVVVRFFDQVKTRWPLFQVDIDSVHEQQRPGQFPPSEELPRDRGEYYAVRDAEMDRYSDEHAYALMSDGEGPFLLIYDRLQAIDFQLDHVIEPASPPGEIGAPAPYRARLCGPAIWRFTLVTSGEVARHPFSQWLHQLLCALCCNVDCDDSTSKDRFV